MLLFLVGCSKEVSINSNAKIILNIDTEVMPEFTSSVGQGSFDITEMQYTLKVNDINPVKISLGAEGYETVVVDITSEELASKLVKKDVSFGTPLGAKVSIKVRTEVDMASVKVEGYEFIQQDNEFIANVTSRDEEIIVKVSATDEYQTLSFTIKPDDMKTGLYENEVLLVKKDESIVKFSNSQNQKNFTTQLYNLSTSASYEPRVYKGDIYFVVNKDEELYYNDIRGVYIHYIKAIDNIVIDLFQKSNEPSLLYKTYQIKGAIDTRFDKNMYYELNNRLFPITISSRFNIKVPLGSKLLFTEFKDGIYILKYHNNFDQTSDSISLDYNDFNITVPFRYKLRLYDVVNKHYVEDLILNSNSLVPNSDMFYEGLTLLSLSNQDYDISLIRPLNDAIKQGNEWVIDTGVMPMYKGVILKFVDKNKLPVYINDISILNLSIDEDKVTLKNAMFPMTNFQLNFVNTNGSVTKDLLVFVEGRWYYTKTILFAHSFEFVEMGGNNYLICKNPIELMYDKYNLRVGIDGVQNNNNVRVSSSSGHEIEANYNYTILNVKRVRLNDIIRLTVTLDGTKHYVNIKCTNEVLERGVYYYSLIKKEKLEVNQLRITLSDDYIFYPESYVLNYGSGYMSMIVDESKRACTIYYLGNQSKVTIKYKRESNGFENSQIIYITEANQTNHIG
jgi:hypothetical protein